MRALASKGHTTATDLADWLVREVGMPFRDAHHITGAGVLAADKADKELSELTAEELAGVDRAHHAGRAGRADGGQLGRAAAPRSAAPRPRGCGRRRPAGARACRRTAREAGCSFSCWPGRWRSAPAAGAARAICRSRQSVMPRVERFPSDPGSDEVPDRSFILDPILQ